MPDDDQRHHEARTPEARLDLIERDLHSHARSLTALVKNGASFSPEQLRQMRTLLREEFGDVGLRIDEPEHVDDARRDFMFLRSLRKAANGTAAKVGWFFIAALLGAVVWLVNSGLTLWKNN